MQRFSPSLPNSRCATHGAREQARGCRGHVQYNAPRVARELLTSKRLHAHKPLVSARASSGLGTRANRLFREFIGCARTNAHVSNAFARARARAAAPSETSSDCSFLTVVFSALGRTAQRARVSTRHGGIRLEAAH